MICQLCLKEELNCRNVSDEINGKLSISYIINQHFWFKSEENIEPISNTICEKCWNIVHLFHQLYEQVKEAHKNLSTSELMINHPNNLNDNDDHTEISVPNAFTFCTLNDNFFKQEINDTILYESNENDNLNKSIVQEDAIAKVAPRKSKRLLHLPKPCIPPPNKYAETIKGATKKTRGRPSKIQIQSKSTSSNLKQEKPTEKLENTESKEEKLKLMKNEDEMVLNYMKLMCAICSIESKTFTELKYHFKLKHKQMGYIDCCGITFFKRYEFIDHIKTHISPGSMKCNLCGKGLRNRKGVQAHMKNMHSKKEKSFHCDECDKVFFNKCNLARHKLTHVPEEDKQFSCKDCGKCFPSQGVLRTHSITTHESRYGGICDLCGKKYQSPQDLKRHRLEHDGIQQPKAQCEVCGDWVSNKYKLKRHMIKHLTSNMENKCNLCDKVAPNALALKSHIRFTHVVKRKHQCNICNKVFRRTLDLKEHMTVHTGEALYVCPHCPRTFTHHSNMHHHRKKMHRTEFDEERKNRGRRKVSWNKETELKRPTTSATIYDNNND